jgi:uncharacterized protein YbjT (DUF2867 family)
VTNRATLAQLRDMTPEQVNSLPLDQIAALLEDVADAKADAKRLDDKLTATMHARFAERAAELRRASGKDTGRVSIRDGEFVIKADLPKKVDWDEDGLAAAERQLRNMGEPVEEYIRVKRIVMEGAYEKWPSSLRAIFAPARTVGVGKASFAIERAKKDAA